MYSWVARQCAAPQAGGRGALKSGGKSVTLEHQFQIRFYPHTGGAVRTIHPPRMVARPAAQHAAGVAGERETPRSVYMD